VYEQHVVLREHTHVRGRIADLHRGDRFGKIKRAAGDDFLPVGAKDDLGARQRRRIRLFPNCRWLRARW